MRPWVRLRAAARRTPDGEPPPEAVRAGGHDARSPGPDRPDGSPGPGGPEPDRVGAAGSAGPMAPVVPPVVVPRWVQMVILPLALLALWELARAAGTILLVLIVAALVALILAPLVRGLEKGMPRGLAILTVYLGGLAVVVAIGFLLANPVATQVSHFENNVPSIVDHANRELANIQRWLNNRGLHVHIQQQGQTALQTLQKNVLKRSSTIVSFSRDLLSGVVTVGFDLVLILVLSIYLLIYGHQIGELVRRMMPPGDGTPEDDYPRLAQQAVSGYVRGQLLFSLAMGASAGVALTILGLVGIFPAGETYGAFFGAFYGLMEFIPYIGPIIGPIPAVLVALFQNPISAVWLIILFVALQQLEGHVAAPQIFRLSLRINPILVILALLIGYQIYGIAGALVALPVSAVLRQTVVYLRRHLVLEPWSTRGPEAGLMGPAAARAGPSPPPPSDRCPDCGAPAGEDDAYCRSCGAALTSGVGAPR